MLCCADQRARGSVPQAARATVPAGR